MLVQILLALVETDHVLLMLIFQVKLLKVFSQESSGVEPPPVLLYRDDVGQQLGVELLVIL